MIALSSTENHIMTKPLYDHDCDHCTFLGTVHYNGDWHDLYVCRNSVLARNGDDGPEYSFAPFEYARSGILAIAAKLATDS